MKKLFPLHAPAQNDLRVIESIKHDVRKYLKRERRKPLPEGFELWEFNCRVGPEQTTAVSTTAKTVIEAIDAVAKNGGDTVYVEILATAAKWPARIPPVTEPVAESIDPAQ